MTFLFGEKSRMPYIREENIATTSFIYAIVMVLLLTFTTGGLLIAKKFHALRRNLVTLEHELVLRLKRFYEHRLRTKTRMQKYALMMVLEIQYTQWTKTPQKRTHSPK